MWVATTDLPTRPRHPFYARLNQMLRPSTASTTSSKRSAQRFYADDGAARVAAGHLFPAAADRLLRRVWTRSAASRGARRIRWRCATFSALDLPEAPPDHSTISRTRRLIDLETHRGRLHLGAAASGGSGLGQGQDGRHRCHDAGSQRGDAQHRAAGHGRELPGVSDEAGPGLGHRDADARGPGAARSEAEEEGLERRLDDPHDPDAKITKMKDGRTHLAHKAEHAVEPLRPADQGDESVGGQEGTRCSRWLAMIRTSSVERRKRSATDEGSRESDPARFESVAEGPRDETRQSGGGVGGHLEIRPSIDRAKHHRRATETTGFYCVTASGRKSAATLMLVTAFKEPILSALQLVADEHGDET